MVQTILLIVILILFALALIVFEIFTPTFGVLAVLALGALTLSAYLGFSISPAFGVILVCIEVLGLPVYVYWALKVIPNTKLGMRLALKRKAAKPGEGTPEADDLAALVGAETTAETVLRPSGTIRLNGRRIVAQAESNLIEKGAKVKVVRAAGTHVVVRKIEA